ncbi:hypothetical protein INR49_006630 [Caranx melampygus]|nr:hypothetical protein INR49_006630 [Caranx melampygus]
MAAWGLNSPLRSPLLPPRPFRAPSEHARPTTLQIPVVSFSSAPPELSPDSWTASKQTPTPPHHRSLSHPSLSPAAPPSPYPGTREHSEIKQSVSMLTEEWRHRRCGSARLPPPHPPLTQRPHPSPPQPPAHASLPEGPPAPSITGSFCPCCRTSPPDHPHPLTLSLLLHVSLLLTVRLPLPGPPPCRPASCASRAFLPPPPSQDTPPPHSSHCSAPPSLSSSPGDHQLRLSPFVPLVPSSHLLHPSTTSLPCLWTLTVHGDAQRGHPDSPMVQACARPPQELEMQEWGSSRWRRGGRPQSTSASSMRRSQRYEAGT